jgi:Flp pilus assembly pilin Flp
MTRSAHALLVAGQCDFNIRFVRKKCYNETVKTKGGFAMYQLLVFFSSEDGQDIAEYAVMVAVILLIVVGTLRIIGSNSNTVFSQVASSIG